MPSSGRHRIMLAGVSHSQRSCYLITCTPTDLYLIDPPSSAIHKLIPPSKIVFAGDSAGGGLCITVLTILRDMGLPQPAGAVLISPWVDLTHSFPSILENTETVRYLVSTTEARMLSLMLP